MAKASTAREHIEKARDILGTVSATYGGLGCDQLLALAQIHATLALAEATRTANKIAGAQAEHAMTDDVYLRIDN